MTRRREYCYREECRAFFRDYKTVVVDCARNGRVVSVVAICHGAEYAGADVWWWYHMAGAA